MVDSKQICLCFVGLTLALGPSPTHAALILDEAFVELTFSLGYGGEGATWDGTSLWISDPSSGVFNQYDVTGTPSHAGSLSVSSLGLGGLTWDGTHVWDNPGDTYRKISSVDGSIVEAITVQGTGSPGGLAFDGQYLWKASRPEFTQIDPVTGTIVDVIAGINLPGIDEGLAFYNDHLFAISYTSELDPTIWAIDTITGTLLSDSFALPHGLYNGLTFDGASFWAVNWSEQMLVKVSFPSSIPEPGAFVLFVFGLTTVAFVGRRRRIKFHLGA